MGRGAARGASRVWGPEQRSCLVGLRVIQEEGWTERLRQPSWISTAGLEFAGIPEVPVQPGWSHRKGKKG